MGGHNDQNGNSNGQHDDVSSKQVKSEKFYGCTPCVFVCMYCRHACLADRHFEILHVRQRGRG